MEENNIRINRWLAPLSFLYGLGVSFRNALFDAGVIKSRQFDLPVISVGNLTVGGTGKTPHTEYLIRLLQEQKQVAVLSRGYRRKTKGFVLGSRESTTADIGDEPFQMKQKYPQTYVAVDADRCHGIGCLLGLESPPVDVVLLDDAFQHRYVKSGLNILLTDYNRPVYADCLLPSGRLRESFAGRTRADIVVVTKCPHGISEEECARIEEQLQLGPDQKLYFSALTYGELYALHNCKESLRTLDMLRDDEDILLITGIASPAQLLNDLKKYTSCVRLLSFPDHHNFTEADIQQITTLFRQLDKEKRIIITTEKDATRLVHHPALTDELRDAIHILPINVEILQGKQEEFNNQIINYVNENPRNSGLSESTYDHQT